MSLIRVAVGVVRNVDGHILIALRSARQHQGNLWEFPGGKVEVGESCHNALVRELKEEIGIDVLASEPLIQIEHHYPDKSVLLDVRTITAFNGKAMGCEGQPIKWVSPQSLYDYQFPAANKPILTAINLPKVMAISGYIESEVEFRLRLVATVNRGAELFWLRPDSLSMPYWKKYLNAARTLFPDLPLVVSSAVGEVYWHKLPGLHLTSEHLMLQSARPVLENVLLGASCHNADQIHKANAINVDYITLSPVLATASHPDREAMGWECFKNLTRLAKCPTFALGGLELNQLDQARAHGAHGVASLSYLWN